MSGDQSQALRMRLASVGIFLDEKKEEEPRAAPGSSVVVVDRVRVREILVAAGAPAHDVEWLTASCPSVDHALRYRPPAKEVTT